MEWHGDLFFPLWLQIIFYPKDTIFLLNQEIIIVPFHSAFKYFYLTIYIMWYISMGKKLHLCTYNCTFGKSLDRYVYEQSTWRGEEGDFLFLLKTFKYLCVRHFKKCFWSIVGLPRCVCFCWAAKWFSYMHTHTHTHISILSHILFHYGSSQDIEYRSLCYTVGPCLSILFIIVCIC